ncbi:MAG: putative maltokinase [Candidatus Competibacteraceae bacterium]
MTPATQPPVAQGHTQPEMQSPVLVLSQGWQSFFPNQVNESSQAMAATLHEQLTRIVLPGFLANQRWFAAKGERIESVAIIQQAIWKGKREWLLAQAQVTSPYAGTQTYSLPLALAWEQDGAESLSARRADTLARVRQNDRRGILYDAFADETFCQDLLAAMGQQALVPVAGGLLKFSSTAAFARLAGDNPLRLPVRRATAASSNTTILLGDRLFLKAYRRLRAGINPELEMGRFLTEVSPYSHIVPLAGALEYQDTAGTITALAMLQGFVANQGDAWSYTLERLSRFLRDCVQRPAAIRAQLDTIHEAYMQQLWTLGRRTGELHRALAKTTGDPAFDPEPIGPADLQRWVQQVYAEAAQTLDQLERHLSRLPDAQQPGAQRLLAARPAVLARIQSLQPAAVEAVMTRYHGDYHLGQVLVAQNDFILIDFEGEPGRTLQERRRKHSPLRDVAGMLRSFNYAANSALSQVAVDQPAAATLLEPFVKDWEWGVRKAFLAGYREAVQGCPVYPEDPQAAGTLLELFLLEKAFYELRYELDNRPDWVHVPLGGLSELLLSP